MFIPGPKSSSLTSSLSISNIFFRYLLNGILASPAILLEQPGRRIEVILYIALRGLLTGWQLLLKRGLARRVPQWDTALFSLSMGVVMSVYQSQPEAVSKLYRGALDRVCGRE